MRTKFHYFQAVLHQLFLVTVRKGAPVLSMPKLVILKSFNDEEANTFVPAVIVNKIINIAPE